MYEQRIALFDVCLIRLFFFFRWGCCCGWSYSGVSLIVSLCACCGTYLNGISFFSCFSLGKNVKHHSLDKEPSIIDIFRDLLFLMREKNRKKMLFVCEIVLQCESLLVQVFNFLWEGNSLVILGSQCWHAKSIPLLGVWLLLFRFESECVCFRSIFHAETVPEITIWWRVQRRPALWQDLARIPW